MTASELQARLTAASAVLGDYQRWAAGGAVSGDWHSSAPRLAVELKSACTALRGALSMLADADAVLDDQDATMLLGTGGLLIAPDDADAVLAALADAAECAEREHFPSSPTEQAAARYRELIERLNEDAEPPHPAGAPGETGNDADRLRAIRDVLGAFDWDVDDRQVALERIETIVFGGQQ